MSGAAMDRLAIRELVENWVVWRDSGDWERFRTVWHSDGRMMATWFQGPADDFIRVSREGFARGVSILHFLGGMSADLAGDRARLAADGTIVMLGRDSLVVNTGGEKVYPEEVEGALKSHPDVFDALVIGVPDERWGEVGVACVVTDNESLTLEELVRFSTPYLADFKRPRRVVHIKEALPRGMSGKVLKRQLRSDVLEQLRNEA